MKSLLTCKYVFLCVLSIVHVLQCKQMETSRIKSPIGRKVTSSLRHTKKNVISLTASPKIKEVVVKHTFPFIFLSFQLIARFESQSSVDSQSATSPPIVPTIDPTPRMPIESFSYIPSNDVPSEITGQSDEDSQTGDAVQPRESTRTVSSDRTLTPDRDDLVDSEQVREKERNDRKMNIVNLDDQTTKTFRRNTSN